MGKTETIIVRVTPDMKEDLEKLATRSRRTVSNYLRLLIEDTITKSKNKK